MAGSADICRLCLQNLFNIKSFEIFPQQSEGVHENIIPMRLAAVAAIEITKYDALPKKICETCRYKLESSYTFRKKSQILDAKLRKHYKLLSLGKKSNIALNDDDCDDEEEILGDSSRFLEDFERARSQNLKEKLRAEIEAEYRDRLEKIKHELRIEITQEIQDEVRRNERLKIEEKVRSECLAKEDRKLRNEILEKCRREECTNVLKDLEEFLKQKQTERNNHSEVIASAGTNAQNNVVEETKQERVQSNKQITDKCVKEHLLNNGAQNTKTVFKDVMSYQIRIKNDCQLRETVSAIDDNEEVITVFNSEDFNEEDDDEVPDDTEVRILKVLHEKDPPNVVSAKGSVMENVESSKSSPILTYVCLEQPNNISIGRATNTPKTFKCKLCPVEVSTECSLKRHLRVHKNVEKSVACPECKIVVSCTSALRRHMVLHSGERPYVCGVCKKAFGQREILKRHENTQHRGLRRHKCPQCEREFSQKINLTEHVKQKHLGEPRKRYKCHLCSKSFLFSSGLSRHLTFHSGVTYQCAECVRSFTDRSSIKRHILKVHGVEPSKSLTK